MVPLYLCMQISCWWTLFHAGSVPLRTEEVKNAWINVNTRKRTASKAHVCWHKKICRPSWKVTRVLVHGQKMKTRKTRGGASLLILSMKVTLALLWNQNLREVYPRIQLANLQFCHILWHFYLKYKWVKWVFSNQRFLRGLSCQPILDQVTLSS